MNVEKKKAFKQTNKSKTGAPLSSIVIEDCTTVTKCMSPGSPVHLNRGA